MPNTENTDLTFKDIVDMLEEELESHESDDMYKELEFNDKSR
tara:strand:+ start:957 stop:1082 length:126 start_codon:yes stop_codon:yes gene_type:complete